MEIKELWYFDTVKVWEVATAMPARSAELILMGMSKQRHANDSNVEQLAFLTDGNRCEIPLDARNLVRASRSLRAGRPRSHRLT